MTEIWLVVVVVFVVDLILKYHWVSLSDSNLLTLPL
jgi:hypothetical protein